VFNWPEYFPDVPLRYPPSFDGRIVLYPSQQEVRDYFAWRQADTHINNLYNTAFWALVQQGGQTTTEAHATLRGTVSKEKHEILFSRFGINYNDIDSQYRKGSVVVRVAIPEESGESSTRDDNVSAESSKKKTRKQKKAKKATRLETMHCDIIQDEFWEKYAHLLKD
jgi:tRNA(His) guanylyltransferase